MPSGRSRDDDESDLPRRRDRDGDRFDDRPDDRPRSRRDDDYDDRPRRRYEDDDRPRRRDDYDDDYDRPRRPRPRPRRKGSNVGLWVGLGVGGVVLLTLGVVLAVTLGGGLSVSPVDYEKFQAINSRDTLEGLEKRFGRATKITEEDYRRSVAELEGRPVGPALKDDPRLGGRADFLGLAVDTTGHELYEWRNGSIRVMVRVGPKGGGKGLLTKTYLDLDAARKNRGITDPAKMHPINAIGVL